MTDFSSEYEISAAYAGRRQAPQPLVISPLASGHDHGKVPYCSPNHHLANAQSPASSSFPNTPGTPATPGMPATPHSGFGLFPPPDYAVPKAALAAFAQKQMQLQAQAQAQAQQMQEGGMRKDRRMSILSGTTSVATPSTAPSAYNASFMQSRDALSVSSGSTGLSGLGSTTSKKMQKLEKKM